MNEWANVDGCAIFYLREKYAAATIGGPAKVTTAQS